MSRYLAPAALVLLVQAEAHAAVVRHLLAAVDQHVDVVRVVQRLALAPDHREGRRHVGGAAGVGELHLVAVDRVREQLGVDARHPTLDVELADEPGHVTRDTCSGMLVLAVKSHAIVLSFRCEVAANSPSVNTTSICKQFSL